MRIIDTTLREGEQTPGVLFTPDTKKQIIAGLVALGVEEIELGIASPLNHDLGPLIHHARQEYPDQALSLWCRCLENDIVHAATLQPDILALSIPASDLLLQKKLGKDRNWARSQLQKAIKIAQRAGIGKIAVGLEDASRGEPTFIRELAEIACQHGAFRLRLADTVGIASPQDITTLLDHVTGLDIELGVHCHNDFGMATANSITALDHGAVWVDATIFGLGERAGNCRLEELVAYLVVQKQASYNLKNLPPLSHFVTTATNKIIDPSRPILGAEIFTCETGLHLQGLMRDPATYEPFAPERVGKKRSVGIGAKAGKRVVYDTLKRLGVDNKKGLTLSHITNSIRKQAAFHKRNLSDEEIIQLTQTG